MAETNPAAEREALLKRGEQTLLRSASRWMRDALTAWTEDDYAKVAALSPLAVEHLGKAVLWKSNPALLVPLSQDSEASLFILIERPDLSSPKLRTIGLKLVLGRLDTLLGGLPLDQKQRSRMVDTRNGAMHVGLAEQSRYVLIDVLTLCEPLLARLGNAANWFYGSQKADVVGLLEAKRTEVEHRVAAKRARARMLLERLAEELGSNEYDEMTSGRESSAEYDIDPDDFGSFAVTRSVPRDCPECGFSGRLIGQIDVSHEVEVEYEQIDEDEFREVVASDYYTVEMTPIAFACNVCNLTLHGQQELGAGHLQPYRFVVDDASELGYDFDAKAVAEQLYGGLD